MHSYIMENDYENGFHYENDLLLFCIIFYLKQVDKILEIVRRVLRQEEEEEVEGEEEEAAAENEEQPAQDQ